MLLQKIYEHLPICFQNLMTSMKGYFNRRARYGKAYYRHVDFLNSFYEWTFEEKLKYQETELNSFMKFAVENSAYYKQLYKGIDIGSIKSIKDLTCLPIMDKEMLRKNMEQVRTISKRNAVVSQTGGTTGKSLTVLFTRDDNMKRMAMLDCFKKRHGFINLKMKRATFNGKHIVPINQNKKIFWRYNLTCKQMIFSSFHVTEENIPYYIEALNQFKPKAIDGFFSSIYDIAKYIERKNIKLTFRPTAIFPTSETLTMEGRHLIEQAFKCKVFDQYASSEGAPFLTECSQQILHVEMASGIFEQLDDSGEILVTSFTTHGTPLIRYRIGDKIQLTDRMNICKCGDNQPIVESIQGRTADYLFTAEGKKINGGNICNIFKNIPNALIQSQLIQKEKNAVTALLVVDEDLYKKKYDDILTENFKRKFGENTKLRIKHVKTIEREKSGKVKLIINHVDEQ